MILIRYYDSCSCESKSVDCKDIAKAKEVLMELVSSDVTSEFEIYECERLYWNVDIFGIKESK